MPYTRRKRKRKPFTPGHALFHGTRNRGNGGRAKHLPPNDHKRGIRYETRAKTVTLLNVSHCWGGSVSYTLIYPTRFQPNSTFGAVVVAHRYINYIYLGEFSETMRRRVVEGLLCRRRLQWWRSG